MAERDPGGSPRRWRIVFMGTPDFAVPSLEALIRSPDDVVAVVCQPDRAAGRGQRTSAPPVKRAAMGHGVPVSQFPTLREAAARDRLAAWAPDLIVVAAYGKILPQSVLDIPPHGCINVHASLLPRHRGAAPIQRAILAGDRETGVTIMQMSAAMDAGDILVQRRVPIGPTDTSITLGHALAHLGAAALVDTIAGLKAGEIAPVPQDASRATLAPRIEKAMGDIDWTQPAGAIERAVRAFQPWPAAYTSLDGKRLKVLRARVAGSSTSGSPGTILDAGPTGIAVATGAGTLVLTEVQLEGHRALPVESFIRGHPVTVGTVLRPAGTRPGA